MSLPRCERLLPPNQRLSPFSGKKHPIVLIFDHLVHTLNTGGERKKRSAETLPYNSLVQS